MSEFDSLITTAMREVSGETVAGDAFTLSQHAGSFHGVFRGEQASVDHMLSGHDTKATDAVSVTRSQFASPPVVGELLTRTDDGVVFRITEVDTPDAASYDLALVHKNKES